MADKLDLYHCMDNYYLGEYTQEFNCINIVSDLGVLPQGTAGGAMQYRVHERISILILGQF